MMSDYQSFLRALESSRSQDIAYNQPRICIIAYLLIKAHIIYYASHNGERKALKRSSWSGTKLNELNKPLLMLEDPLKLF